MLDLRYFKKRAELMGADIFGITNHQDRLALVLGFGKGEYKDLDLIDTKTNYLKQILENKGHIVTQIKASKNSVSLRRLAIDAGLGFIGKNNLLITEKYGPDIRLTGLLVDVNLPFTKIITKNLCGDCMDCIKACPSGALGKRDEGKCREYVEGIKDQRCMDCIDSCQFTGKGGANE